MAEWGHEEEGRRPFPPVLEIPLAQGREEPPSVPGGRFSAPNYVQLRSANGAGFGLSNEGAGSAPNNILLTSLLRSNSPRERRRGLAETLLSTKKKPSKRALASPPASPSSIIWQGRREARSLRERWRGARGGRVAIFPLARPLVIARPLGEGGPGVWITCLISGCMTSLSHISDTLPEVIGKPLEWPRDL